MTIRSTDERSHHCTIDIELDRYARSMLQLATTHLAVDTGTIILIGLGAAAVIVALVAWLRPRRAEDDVPTPTSVIDQSHANVAIGAIHGTVNIGESNRPSAAPAWAKEKPVYLVATWGETKFNNERPGSQFWVRDVWLSNRDRLIYDVRVFASTIDHGETPLMEDPVFDAGPSEVRFFTVPTVSVHELRIGSHRGYVLNKGEGRSTVVKLIVKFNTGNPAQEQTLELVAPYLKTGF